MKRKNSNEIEGISVIVPAHNEEGAIYETARQIVETCQEIGRPYEVILVNDGSTDHTADEIAAAENDFACVESVTLKENAGKGNALKRGFQISKYEKVCMIDADLDLPPYQIKNLLEELENKKVDVVIGSKRHHASRLNYPWYRKLYSTVYYFFILLIFRLPIKDTQTGIKIFRREVLSRVFPRLVCKQFALDLELLVVANRMGYTIAEAPVIIDFHKEYGHIGWLDIRNIIVDTLAIAYRLYFLRYYNSPLLPAIEKEPKISIIVPSKKLDKYALECLSKCLELNYSNYDVIFLPDEEPQEVLPDPIRVIPSGPVSPSAKRNLGAKSSDATILAFIDSDAFPDPDWLRNSVPYFEDESISSVCGPAITPTSDSKRQQASGLLYSSSLVSGSTTFRYTHHASRTVEDYPSCNMLVRRTEFLKVGGFIEEFWPGEDTVLCLKLTKELKKRIIYIPNVVVYHHRRPVYAEHLKQVGSYAWHRGFFAKIYPETSRKLQFFVPSIFVIFLIIGAILSCIIPPIRIIYLSVLGLYALLVLFSSIKSLDILTNLLIIPGIVATHLTYGTMFLAGLIRRKRK